MQALIHDFDTLKENYDELIELLREGKFDKILEFFADEDGDVTSDFIWYFMITAVQFDTADGNKFIKWFSERYDSEIAAPFRPNPKITSNTLNNIISNLEFIPTYFFSLGQDIGGWDFSPTLVIPDNITSIETYAFLNNSKIKEVIVSGHCEYIDDKAFKDCKNLEKITLKPGVKSLYMDAYAGTKVKEINLPSTMKNFYASHVPNMLTINYDGTSVDFSRIVSQESELVNAVVHCTDRDLIYKDGKRLEDD